MTLVEYGDYQCSYCGQAEVVIRELLVSFGDELRYVWRHLPLNDVHPNAQMAAEAAEAAAAQGAFWEMNDRLLEHQDELTPPDLARLCGGAGPRRRALLRTSSAAASTRPGWPRTSPPPTPAGWPARPSFFINGRRHQGAYDVSTLTAAVRSARYRARVVSPEARSLAVRAGG